ncbi:MAG: FIST N-terminal domain-containing protein [Rhodoferax sp.]
MKTVQVVLRPKDTAFGALQPVLDAQPDWILVFGPVARLRDAYAVLRPALPQAQLLGCSTAGEISDQGVSDAHCVVTGVRWANTRSVGVSTGLAAMDDSEAAGLRLAQQLPAQDLRSVVVLGQGVAINGTALAMGLGQSLPPGTLITGGLAGDGAVFAQTHVLCNEGVFADRVAALGLYGHAVRVCHGSFGGWMPFGPFRKVTRCQGNVLFELDGEPALSVYRRYLGEHARQLPASGLLFPFAMAGKDRQEIQLIRTILGIDEDQGSLILAGDIDPQGYLRLMHASTDSLVDGAEAAAKAAAAVLHQPGEALALLVSCVGRKLVMGGRVDDEVDAVRAVLGQGCRVAGFYSYGEISPFTGGVACQLHNQTMTITTWTESAP